MPSKPSLQAWRKMVAPSPSMCSFHRRPGPTFTSRDRSVALRTSSGSRRRSSPSSSIRSKAYRNIAIEAPIPNPVEYREAVVIAGNRLAVDDARSGAQVSQRLDNQREAVRQVVAWAAVEPHLGADLAGDDPEAVVLDFMNP